MALVAFMKTAPNTRKPKARFKKKFSFYLKKHGGPSVDAWGRPINKNPIKAKVRQRKRGKRVTELQRWIMAATAHWSDDLNLMPYNLFLKTKYWRIVRALKRLMVGNKCQKCGSSFHLETHHLHYRSRGNEHKDMNCIIILCDICHRIQHGIIPERKRGIRDSKKHY